MRHQRRSEKIRWLLAVVGVVLGIFGGHQVAEANVDFSWVKAGATDVTMNDPPGNIVTYTITNTGSDPINKIAFKLPNASISTGSFTWTAATTAPSIWTAGGFGTGEVTLTNSVIDPGASATFTLTVGTIPTWTADVTDRLTRIRAWYDKAKKTINNPTLFTRHALRIVSMVAAPSVVAPGSSFTLVLNVRNESSTLKDRIFSDPSPPTLTVISGSITNPTKNQTPAPVPDPLSLGAGATGTITYTYTTAAADNGTIVFSITRLRHPKTGAVTATSVLGAAANTSNTVIIGGFVGVITTDKSCLYDGNIVRVTMTLTNFTAAAINNVTPTLTPGGTAVKTLQSGPSPAPPINVPAASSRAFTWDYRINDSTPGVLPVDNYSFTGTAVGTSPAIVNGWSGGKVGEYVLAPPLLPTNAYSTNACYTWSFVNNGCAASKSVSIALAAGWTWGGDAYSLTDQGALDPTESWSPPTGANPVVFTAPSVAEQLQLLNIGRYQLVLGTPTTPGVSLFQVTVTDANDQAATISPTPSIQVNAFSSGSPNLNKADTDIWREEVR